jgi:hypothetical protein
MLVSVLSGIALNLLGSDVSYHSGVEIDRQLVPCVCIWRVDSFLLPAYITFAIILHTLKMSVYTICMAVLSVILKLFHFLLKGML